MHYIHLSVQYPEIKKIDEIQPGQLFRFAGERQLFQTVIKTNEVFLSLADHYFAGLSDGHMYYNWMIEREKDVVPCSILLNDKYSNLYGKQLVIVDVEDEEKKRWAQVEKLEKLEKVD